MTRVDTDVLVVGGGPAGLAAAHQLRRLGVGRVVLCERDTETGGVPRHCGHSPFGMREFGRVLGGRDYARKLNERAQDAGVDIRLRHSVVAIASQGADVASPEGPIEVAARAIVLATGIREMSRAGRLLPGQRPVGIVTTGALQDLVYLKQMLPFRRPVIVGSELVTMSAVLTCRRAGIDPVAVVEEEVRPRLGYGLTLFPRVLEIPVHYGTVITDVFGHDRVEAVELRHGDGRVHTLKTDGLLLTGRFTPESSLARVCGVVIDDRTGGPAIDADYRTSVPNVFAVGNVLRAVKTAGHCWMEGRRAANTIAAALGVKVPQ